MGAINSGALGAAGTLGDCAIGRMAADVGTGGAVLKMMGATGWSAFHAFGLGTVNATAPAMTAPCTIMLITVLPARRGFVGRDSISVLNIVSSA
jgi:hypothetical protein